MAKLAALWNTNRITRRLQCSAALSNSRGGHGTGVCLESVYERHPCRYPDGKGLSVQRQVAIPIQSDGKIYDDAFKVGTSIVGNCVIIEIKSVDPNFVGSNNRRKQVTHVSSFRGSRYGRR